MGIFTRSNSTLLGIERLKLWGLIKQKLTVENSEMKIYVMLKMSLN